jgi:hypothetical protein
MPDLTWDERDDAVLPHRKKEGDADAPNYEVFDTDHPDITGSRIMLSIIDFAGLVAQKIHQTEGFFFSTEWLTRNVTFLRSYEVLVNHDPAPFSLNWHESSAILADRFSREADPKAWMED